MASGLDEADVRRGLALALRDMGDAKGAGTEFRHLLRSHPADGVSLYNLVALARRSGSLEKEESAWAELLDARPNDLFAIRAFLGFTERAGRDALRRAIDTIPAATTTIPGLRRRAWLLAADNRWDEAATALYGALRRDPSDPRTLTVLTEVLDLRPALLPRLAEKLEIEMKGSTAQDHRERSIHNVLMARLVLLTGQRAEALRLAKRAVAIDPDAAAARGTLAEFYQRAGRDPDEVLPELKRAVASDPSRLVAHVDLALALLRSGRAEEAVAAARAGLEHLPGSSELHSILGAAQAELGDMEEAAARYRAALLADPADNLRLARSQYSMMLAALGRHFEARRALAGELPPIPEALYQEAWSFVRDSTFDRTFNGQEWLSWKDHIAAH
jgi:tetratricopeptide (TPR) repeat protein